MRGRDLTHSVSFLLDGHCRWYTVYDYETRRPTRTLAYVASRARDAEQSASLVVKAGQDAERTEVGRGRSLYGCGPSDSVNVDPSHTFPLEPAAAAFVDAQLTLFPTGDDGDADCHAAPCRAKLYEKV